MPLALADAAVQALATQHPDLDLGHLAGEHPEVGIGRVVDEVPGTTRATIGHDELRVLAARGRLDPDRPADLAELHPLRLLIYTSGSTGRS